jgi:hypothetical protein
LYRTRFTAFINMPLVTAGHRSLHVNKVKTFIKMVLRGFLWS